MKDDEKSQQIKWPQAYEMIQRYKKSDSRFEILVGENIETLNGFTLDTNDLMKMLDLYIGEDGKSIQSKVEMVYMAFGEHKRLSTLNPLATIYFGVKDIDPETSRGTIVTETIIQYCKPCPTLCHTMPAKPNNNSQ